jgi:hypothetical protein
VLATEKNEMLLAALLPPGVAWTLNTAAVIPFSLPRVKIRWRLWAWLASLPGWVVPVSAAAGFLVFLGALVLWYRRARRTAMARRVAPDEVTAAAAELASFEYERQPPRHSASGGSAPRNWGHTPTPGPPRFGDIPTEGVRARLDPERLHTFYSTHSRLPSFAAQREWEEGGLLSLQGGRPSQQRWEEERGAPRRRTADAFGEGFVAPPQERALREEFAQQAAPAAAPRRGLRVPARHGAPTLPLPTPRVALSPQRVAAAAALRAPQPRGHAVRSPSQARAAVLALRARAEKAAAEAAAALAAAEAEEAAEVGEFPAEDAAGDEGGGEVGESEEVDEEEAAGAEEEAPEEEDEEEGAAGGGGPFQPRAASRSHPQARPRLARPPPQRHADAAIEDAPMDSLLMMAQQNAQRAREGHRQVELRQRQRGAGAAVARSGPASQARAREGGYY